MKKSNKNSIDIDKVAENPGLLPYAHHVGSAIIKPIDKGRTKGNAMTAMYQQTDNQLTQIKEQVEVLIRQAQEIHDRISISERIYKADCGFKPVINKTYYVYQRKDESWVLSMISPEEWGPKGPYLFVATCELLADHTWSVIDKNEDVQFM
ncbi:MAG: DUF2452 domain-containing protein [Bacteroidota bacterium]